jgi:isopentenyl-diphosphate Delta-isomerase
MREDEDLVVLVDEEDREVGFAPKLAAHQLGQRHRAVSVCLIDPQGRMLLQRRAIGKYHSGGLWTNACCTHPRPGEGVQETAERRLLEELGLACGIRFMLRTHYHAPVGKGLVENEIVHLFSGDYDGGVKPNPDEVEDVAWRSHEFLRADLPARPDAYTCWFNHYIRNFGDLLFVGSDRARRTQVRF